MQSPFPTLPPGWIYTLLLAETCLRLQVIMVDKCLHTFQSNKAVLMILCRNCASCSPYSKLPKGTILSSSTRLVRGHPYLIVFFTANVPAQAIVSQLSTFSRRSEDTSLRNISCIIAKPIRSFRVIPNSVSHQASNSRRGASDICGQWLMA